MKRLLILALAASGIVGAIGLAGPPNLDALKLVRVYYQRPETVQILADLGADIAEVRGDYLTVVMEPADIAWIRAGGIDRRLHGDRLRLEVIMEDADQAFSAFRASPDLGLYHTWDEARREIEAAAGAFPGIVRLIPLGTSLEGRPILALKITDQPDIEEGEDAYLFTGLHHAREWISAEVPLALIRRLTEGYGRDPAITRMVNERETWVIPVVNPDGLAYSQSEFRMWRKNRRMNQDDSRGVDLNRNYGYAWGGSGASAAPRSDTYRGPEPFSEPEIQAVRDLSRTRRFRGAISFHSYSELILWPWGYTDDLTSADAALAYFGRGMARFNGYEAGQVSRTLYLASGGFDDYMFGEFGTLAYTIELGRQFIPPEEEVPGIVDRNVAAAEWFLGNCCQVRVAEGGIR